MKIGHLQVDNRNENLAVDRRDFTFGWQIGRAHV